MATFANQTSNISALKSKFQHLLQTKSENDDDTDTVREANAQRFISTQTTRIHRVEKELLLATQDILPSSNESKTITELAELCRLTQTASRQKLELLKRRLQEAGYTVYSAVRSSAEKPEPRRYTRQLTDSTAAASTSSLLRNTTGRSPTPSSANVTRDIDASTSASILPWTLTSTIGGPLESVLEGDAETDGATTPGSMLQSPSPMLWNSSAKKIQRSSRTPPSFASPIRNKINNIHTNSISPSMPRLSLSASTADFLRRQQEQHQHQQQDGNNQDSNSLREEIQPHRTPEKSKGSLSSFVQRTQTPKVRHDGQQNQQQNRPWNTEFREEDDMITLDTQSTFTKPTSPMRHTTTSTATTKTPSQREDRSSFFARMEGMLNRVEETIMEDHSPPRRYRGDEPSRPSDEIQASLSTMPRSETQKHQYSHYQRTAHRSLYQEESYSNGSVNCSNSIDGNEDGSDDEDDDDNDDSTNMAPTLIAEKNQSFHHVACKSSGWSTDEKLSKRPHPLNTLQQQQVQIQRPTHILVDRAISSPAHTNITMDATMMNDTFASFLGMDETQLREKMAPTQEHPNSHFNDDDTIDNLSTVTPVLDRYRLDPDDENSIGVKVVPNERGSHQKLLVQTSGQKQRSHPFMTSSSRPKTPKETPTLPIFSASDFLSPQQTPTTLTARQLQQRTPGSISTQNKKVYRKTPFPKRKATHEQDNNSSTFNENEHPNASTWSSVAASPGVFQKSLAPIESISITVPPLRPRSLDSRRLEENFSIAKGPNVSFDPLHINNKHPSKNSTLQRIDQEENATIDQMDKTIERIDQEPAAGGNTIEKVDLTSGRVDPVGKSFLSQVKSMTQTSTAARPSLKSSNLKKITVEEFDRAPRIVRTQVSVEEANHALDLLQVFCNHDPMEETPSLQFSEERGHEILSSLTGSKHRSKSILISLCHWQRLSMRRDTVRGTMVFVVNSAAKDRTFLY
ncbi:hypothetical protein IV203_037536 [Nitzschia inconspicua]|uniref:Uncharacterized protein n=1 Tax=Nitzschia inconspicua TaxID=303405 RepID=A0A9K3Q125_9STRA|nr:hypothetical protein IV203_037536 [Nitzschia inconspicua]